MSARLLRVTAVGLAAAAILVQSALASGEPKNEWPFTRPVTVPSSQTAASPVARRASIQGEPKNEAPFTRPATVVIASSRGFDWTSGAIGGAAGLGVAILGTGGFLLVAGRKSARPA
jgi:hypothetical protein